jgi:hypothetical protein
MDINETWSNFDEAVVERNAMFRLGSAKEVGKRQLELNEERDRRQERGKRDKVGFEKASGSTAKDRKRRDRSASPPARFSKR